jgi:Putative threonine efflux protein
VHAIFAALGAAVLIQQFPLIYEALRWIGVAYLLFLAWEGWQTQAETSPGRADLRRTAGPLLLRGFLSNVFNPKSIIFFVSVVPRFVETEPGALAIPIQMAVLGCLYVGIATMVHATIVVMAVQLKAVAYRWKTTGHNAPSVVRGPRLRGGMAGLDHETLKRDEFKTPARKRTCPINRANSSHKKVRSTILMIRLFLSRVPRSPYAQEQDRNAKVPVLRRARMCPSETYPLRSILNSPLCT